MKIQAIRENSIAVYTDFDELNSRGIQMKALNGQNTADMIRQSFADLGMDADGIIDVETYINGRAVLIFARIFKPSASVCAICRFGSFENVISASHASGEDTVSSLFFADDAYYLIIHGNCTATGYEFLSEYGTVEPACRLRYAYLCEHGKLICQGNAVKTVRRNFHPNHSEDSHFADSLNAYD